MRATGLCRGCAVALVAIFVGGAWSLELKDRVESWKSKLSHCDPLNDWPTSWARRGGQKALEIQQDILGVLVTSQVAVTVAYPKITEAPIVRRKLGSNKWDKIHEGIHVQKRDGTCATDYKLCPKSMNGGCCPNNYDCGESSCLPASTAIPSACGKLNYAACGIDDGGGCCPVGYACGRAGCTQPVGVTHSETCGASSYLCPASLNFGCCKSGMGCGIDSCYSTAITTFTLTETLTTTDSNSNAQTLTSTIVSAVTPTAPTATASSNPNAVPKATQTPTPSPPIPKTEASGDDSSSGGGGLTGAQLGGIIAGAVAILIVVLVAAFMIMRRLNKAIKASDANSRSRTRTASSGPPRSRPRQRPVDVDAMSVDPLMMSPSEVSEMIQIPSQASSTPNGAHEADSSPIFRSPFSPRSPPFATYQRGYNPVATSESQYSTSSAGGYRNGSVESTPPMSQIPSGGYFDIPPHTDHNSPTSYTSPASQGRRPSHGRNWSNASDQSAISQGSDMAELEAGPDGDRRSSLQKALQGMGLGRMVSRRRSEPGHHNTHHYNNQQPTQLTGGPTRHDWSPPAVLGGPGGGAGRGALGHIAEAGESRIGLDVQPDGMVGGSINAQMKQLSISGPAGEGAFTRREEYG